jgi:hypothetical protein
MAIPFLNNINLSNNELWNARLHNTGSANTNPGQIYFDTGDNLAKYYSNGTDTWVSLKDYSFGNGTFVNLSTSGTTAKPIITADLSATGTADSSTFLRGDNTWATVAQENDFLTGLSFNTSDGVLTATVSNQPDVTVDLDGRYALPSDIITYDLDSIQVGSDVAITLVGSDAIVDTVTLVAGTNVTLTDNGLKSITIDAANIDQTVELTGEVTGTGTTSITTTVADGVLDVANFNTSAIVTAAEGIENNDNDTTLPTSASVKAYVDASVVGGLVYQGGYNADTNTPDLDALPITGIKKGWTYTVTADGSFFTEQVRVGDVLIAEIDSPAALADWTTVQNNIDIASASQIGIGNVAAGSGVDVSYASGTATISLTTVAARSGSIPVPTSAIYTYPNSITVFSTNNVLIQLVDSNGETVYADVQRLSPTTFSVDYGVTEPTGVVALIQLIG